jgi:anti-anti-sigma factor
MPTELHEPTSDLFLVLDLQVASLRVAGELDRTCAHHLADAVTTLAATGCAVWTLDLRDLRFCDVEGLRVLHRARDLARSRGRVLRLLHMPRLVAALLPLLEQDDDRRPAHLARARG